MVRERISSGIHNAFRSSGLRQSILMVFGNSFAQGISAIALIIITRQLGPTSFGEFSVGFAILLILNRLNDLGMSFVVQKYVPRESDQGEISALISYGFRIKLIGALTIALIGVICTPFLVQLLHFEQPLIIYLAFVLSGVTVLYEQLLASLQALHRFSSAVLANALQASTKLIGALGILVIQSATSLPIFTWYMLAPVASLLAAKRLFPRWVRLNLRANFQRQQVLSKSLASHSAVAFIAAGIIENIDVLFVQAYLNTYEAGLLAGVSRIALLFNMMAYSLGTVLNPRAARYTRLLDMQSFLNKSWLVVAASVVGFLALLPFQELLIKFTIGESYLSGAPVMIILLAAAFLSIAVMPFIALFFSLDLPWFFSLSGIMQLVIIIAGNMLFVPIFGVEAAAWTRLVARLALFALAVGLAVWSIRRKARTVQVGVRIGK